MKEIKFRIFDKKRKEIYPVHSYFWEEQLCGNYNLADIPDDLILMQYTGLKDKNGKEIYEGDIIQWSWQHGVCRKQVIYTPPAFHLEGYHPNMFDSLVTHYWEEGKKKKYEIIGNIHKNPELLEVKK